MPGVVPHGCDVMYAFLYNNKGIRVITDPSVVSAARDHACSGIGSISPTPFFFFAKVVRLPTLILFELI